MRVKRRFLIIVTAFLLTGCWDRREINDVAFVSATSIDKEKKDYKVAIQIPLPGQMGGATGGGGGTSGEKKWYIDSETDKTIRAANDKQQKRLSRVLNFSHRRVLIFGEDVAKEGLLPVIDVLIRVPQNRLTAFPVVAEGKGSELLSAAAPIEQFPSEMVREIAIGSFTKPYMLNVLLYQLLQEGIDPVLPVMKVVKSKSGKKADQKTTIQFDGIAIFKEEKMVGIFKKNEAEGVLWLTNLGMLPTVTIPAPNGKGQFVLQFQQTQVDVKPHVKNDRVSATINLKGKGVVLENTSSFVMGSSKQNEQIENEAEKEIKKAMMSAFKKIQQLGADPIGIGDEIKREDIRYWKKIKDDWPKTYKEMTLNIKMDLHVEHTGTLSKSIIRKGLEVK